MRDAQMKAAKGYLGPYASRLAVGDVQSMVFKPTDLGPWYLMTKERKARRHDTPTGKIKTVERTK